MTSVRLSPITESRLAALTEKTGRTKSFYIKQAIEKFLEDQEDRLLVLQALEDKSSSIPYEKLRKQLGLGN